ncbi:McrB family protein [Candidatus Palauibacter sp.]|uniref:McrB family protein n=1 Tax=Candidatus Palauibacter sp. TaxID=3101350 RepID=UPI003C6F0D68
MTEKEAEGLVLLKHYAADADGRVILTRMAESIQEANRFGQKHWTPTVRKQKGWTVTLRIGTTQAIILRREEVEVLLVPDLLSNEEREVLDEAARDKLSFKEVPSSWRYVLDWAKARELWGSVEKAHHHVLQYTQKSSVKNPEADAVIDFLNRELGQELPKPDPGREDPTPRPPDADPGLALLEAYAASETGRVLLVSMAKSIRIAHADNPANWCTTVSKPREYIAMNVGNACAIRLQDGEIRLLLIPEGLDEGVRERLEEATHHSWNRKAVPGARNYMLGWPHAAELWESLEEAHRAAIRAAHRKSATSRRHHSAAVVDYLNRELGLDLPQPDYGPPARLEPVGDGVDDTETKCKDFKALTQALKEAELHFLSEAVASYFLALQTKRFAILTGISGTGKTQIAMAVARSFPSTIRDRRARATDDAAAQDNDVTITARPYHFKYRQIVLPAAFVARIDAFLTPEPNSNGGMIAASYPGGLTKLRFWRDPNPARNMTWLMFAAAHDFRDWYLENLQPGDEFFISFREGETPDEHRIEFRLAATEATERELDNFELVPVRPDWVDNRGLLGYFNPLTGEYAATPFLSLLLEAQAEEERAKKEKRDPHPFFVVLDEMNLARVEHYFSDFLSALESEEPIPLHESEEVEEGRTESGAVVPRQLRVPRNVFFTGTVNVDETTYMFSPKVLDRAFTIEFDRVDLDGFTTGTNSDEGAGLSLDGSVGGLRLTPYRKPKRDDWLEFSKLGGGRFHRTLLELHGILEEEHRHFGYRVANEIARFVNLAHRQSADGSTAAEAAFDLALLQKVLPKFHGTKQELERILQRFFWFAVRGSARARRGDEAVKLDQWPVVDGRLTRASGATVEAEPAMAEIPGDEKNVGAEQPEPSAPESPGRAAGEPAGDGQPPAYPRTGAKIRRMLKRLEQRGFTSFIE